MTFDTEYNENRILRDEKSAEKIMIEQKWNYKYILEYYIACCFINLNLLLIKQKYEKTNRIVEN